ncbi:protein kinase, partial [Nanoarchaeota archaeon]
MLDNSLDGLGRKIGRFPIERELGRGAMGVVYKASHREMGRDIAIKVMARTDGESYARFIREAKLMARINHQNV